MFYFSKNRNMKILKSLMFLFLIIFSFSGCSNQVTNNVSSNGLENMVMFELEQTEGVENLSDETIKALSVIYRTNHLIKNDYNKYEYIPKSEHIKLLTKETKGEVLKQKNGEASSFSNNSSIELSKEIKKSDILSFLKKKQIKLSNISNITPLFDENKNLISLSIGGKEISFAELEREFKLESNKITNIKTSLSSITIFYLPKNTVQFDEKSIDSQAKENKNYKQLLNHFFNDFDLITANF